MGIAVYANGMSIACKAASGKSTAAMPDVCFTQPVTPATPTGVPIPYPNTGSASDTTDGSKTVQIGGQEVMLKDKSTFKQSTGDEAGNAPKKGVVTSQTKGKVNFTAWSMDVKFEGENVPRHLDITLHNEASLPANTPTWPYLDKAAFGGSGPCATVAHDVDTACSGHLAVSKSGAVKRKASMEKMCADTECRKKLSCVVSPYSPNNCCKGKGKNAKQLTPHHIVPKSQFKKIGLLGKALKLLKGKYNADKAPCVCVDGESHSGEGKHAEIHKETNARTIEVLKIKPGRQIPSTERWTVGQAEAAGSGAVAKVTGCPEGCIAAQVRQGHKKNGMTISKSDSIRPTTPGGTAEDETEF